MRTINFQFAILALLAGLASSPLEGADYYVAPPASGGSDTNPGTLAAPYATIQRAANAAVAGDNVIIRAGIYRETVSPANSGTSTSRITYKAYENGGLFENVVISGADPVTGWTAHDTSGGRAIYKTTAMNWNLSDTGASFGTVYRNQIFVNSLMMGIARWPNVPAERLTRLSYQDLALVSAASGSASTATSAWIENTNLAGTFPANYWNAPDRETARVFLSPSTMIWGMSVKIASQSGNRLSLDATGSGFAFTNGYYNPTSNNRFYIYDYYDALDSAGEFWKDTATNTLYLWAPAGANPATLNVEARRRDFGLSLGSRSYLTFRGIKLFGCTMTSDGSSNGLEFDEIEARYIAHIDNYAPTFTTGPNAREFYLRGDGHVVKNSYFNGAAVGMIGASGTNMRIENNVIRDFGYAHHGPAILARNGGIHGNRTLATKNQFLRNTAFNAGHTVVTTDPALDIKYNRIYNSHLRGSDVGAIGIASTDGLGSEISYNVISDAKGPRDNGILYGGFGIYFDYECRNYTVHHNIVWGTTGASFQIMPNRSAELSGVTNMGMKFYHNTGDNDFGIIQPQEVTGVDVRNNLVRRFLNGSGGNYTALPNVQFANNTAYGTDAAAPFRDRINHDLRFAGASSIGVNAGTVISPYTDGFVGPSPDTGALEFDVAPFIAGATILQRQLPAIAVVSIQQNGSSVDIELANLPEGRSPQSGFQARIGSGAFGGTLAYHATTSTWRLIGVSKGSLSGQQPVSVRLDASSPAVTLGSITLSAEQTETAYRAIPMDCGGWFSGFAIHPSGRLYGFGDVFGMWRSDDAGQSWKYLQGDFTTSDTFINGCAVAGNADTVSFLSSSKLFSSTDGGSTWSTVLSGLAPRRDRGATPLIYHPTNSSEMWLASARSGQTGTLWRSPDGGATWLKSGGPTFENVAATTIYIRPEFPDQIWVGAAGGLYVSADHGTSWTQVWNNAGGIPPLAQDGVTPPPTVTAIARRADGIGYIATNTRGWRITALNYNDPASYTPTATVSWWSGWGPNNATVLADGSFLTNTAGDNLSRSTDGGLTWGTPLNMQLVTPPTPAWTAPADASTKAPGGRDMIVQDPTNPARWFMTGGKAPVITTDSGATWKYPPVLNGIAGVPTFKVRFPRGNSTTALIPAADQGAFTVTDGGFSGDVASAITSSIPKLQTYHEVLSSDDGRTLIAAGTDQSPNATIISRSLDAGLTWSQLDLTSAGLPLSYEGITRAVAAPGNVNDFLVLLGSNAGKPNNKPGLYRTVNGGTSFSPVSGIPAGVNTGMRYHHEYSWLETDGINLNTRYLALRSDTDATARGFWHSSDGGTSWAKTSGQPFGSDWIWCMAVDRATAGRVWVAGGYLGIKRSDNGGNTWNTVSGFTDALRIDAAHDRIAVWGKRSDDEWNKIYYSGDNGVTWSEKTGAGQRYANLSDLAVDPNRPGQIWVSGISGNVINPPATAPYIILAGQAPSGEVGETLSYTLQATATTTSWTLVSGSLPPGVTLNASTGFLSGIPTASGSFSATLAATNVSGTTPPVTITLVIQPSVTSFIHEPFAYPVGTNNPDPDAGLNSGFGLPSINVGGNPTGTSTGLRGVWGTTTDVVEGLSYQQANKNLITSGGAARINNASWGGNPYVYRNMVADPFFSQRIGGTNSGSFGVDGTSLFVSFLGSTSSATADAFRFSFKYDGSANFYVSNTTTGWSLNGTTASGAPLALNTPTLFVLHFDFAAGAADSISMWINPTLGGTLGSPNATVTGLSFPGINNVQTRSAVADAMTFDELRIGTSYALVTPFSTPPPAAPTNLAATSGASSQIDLSWMDNSSDETGFKIERSPDGLTSWSQIATLAANTVNHVDSGLASGTYYYRVRAHNSAGDSGWTSIASASATVSKLNQSITFAALPTKSFGDASFSLSASASSGLPVSYASSNSDVASVSGNIVTILSAGSATITASQDGDATYNDAPNVDQTLTVSKAVQSITFGTLATKTYGDAAFSLSASASSGLTVVYASSNSAVATVSGNVVTIVGAGSATITASQSGNVNFNAATAVAQSLTVSKANQNITFGTLAERTVGDPNFTLSATANSGLPVSYASSNTAVVSISGDTVTVVGIGSATITASQPGDANHTAAANVGQTQIVTGGVAFVSESFNYALATNNPDPDDGLNSGYGLPATNTNGNPSGTSTGLRLTWGNTTDVVPGLSYTQDDKVLVTSGGAARINNATWGGNPYVYRFMATDPFLAQRIGGTNSGNFGVDGSSIYVSFLGSTSSATADAFRLSFKYDTSANFYVSNTVNGWSLNGTNVANAPLALNTPSLFVMRFDFAEGAADSISLWVDPPLGAALGSPQATVTGISFPGIGNVQTRAAVADAMTLDELRIGTSLSSVTPHTLSAPAPAAPSGLTATTNSASQITLNWLDNASDETGFFIERSPDGTTGWTQVAAPAANTVSYENTGLTHATSYFYRVRAANSSGSSTWSTIASVSTLKLNQTIIFGAIAGKTFGDAPFALTASASSGLSVSYTSGNTAVATVSGNMVTIVGTGSTTITASQSGNINYNAAPDASQTLTVLDGAQPVQLARWEFAGATGNQPTAPPSSNSSQVIVTSISRGSGFKLSTYGTAFTGDSFAYEQSGGAGSTNATTAMSRGHYTQFTVTPQSGVSLSIANLVYAPYWQNSAPALTNIAVAYSINGGAYNYANLTGTPGVNNGSPLTATLSGVAALQGINTPVTFRLLHPAPVRYQFAGIGRQTGDDVVLTGSVTQLPSAPTGLMATPNVPTAPIDLEARALSSQIELAWTDNATDETGFKLERSLDEDTGWSQIAEPTEDEISFSDTGLSDGITYFYRIRATSTVGDSEWSAIASATTLNGLQGFRAANSLAGDGSQDLLTPAGDGVENLLKYAFNMLGLGAAQAAMLDLPNTTTLAPDGSAGIPFVRFNDAGKLQITYIRRKAASNPGINYAVEFSDALTSWRLNDSAIETSVSLDETFERVTLTDSDSGSAPRFVRVRVTAR